MDILTYALAKSYTDKAILGVGTIKGAPCTVKSQTEDDEYVYVTLGWENNLGASEETIVQIKKGATGEQGPAGETGPQGVSITKIEKIKTEGLIDTYQISFSDDTTFEYTISNGSDDYLNMNNKPSIEGVELIGNKTFEDLNIASAEDLAETDTHLQDLADFVGEKDNLPMPTDTVIDNIELIDSKVDAIIDDNETELAKTFSSDKITKTFATLEEVNERIPQYDKMPIPTEACGGQVVQFIGTTTENYIHNYFYECIQVEDNYEWVNVAVQNIPTKVSELTNDNNFVTETKLTTLINDKTKIADKYVSKPKVLKYTSINDIAKNDVFTGVSTSTSIYATNDASYTSSYTDAIIIVTDQDLEYLKTVFEVSFGKYISYRSSSGELTEYNCLDNEVVVLQYGNLTIYPTGNAILIDGIYPKEFVNYDFPEIDGEITIQDILSDYIEDKIYMDVAVKGKTISMLDYNNYKTHYALNQSTGKEYIISSADDQTLLIGFIPISESFKYSFIGNSLARTMFLYDENKNFLSTKTISAPPQILTKNDFISFNPEAAYFRFYYPYLQNNEFQISPNS